MSSGGLWSWPSRPCEWPAKRLRGRPVSRTVTLRRARPSCRAPARPAKLPPMMMTSSMVISSVLWMEGVGLGFGAKYRPAIRARDGQRAGLRHRREKSPITILAGRTMPHSISPGGPEKLDLEDRLKSTRWLARSRSDRLADLGFSSDLVVVIGVSLSLRLDRRGVRIAAISCGTHDSRENGLV